MLAIPTEVQRQSRTRKSIIGLMLANGVRLRGAAASSPRGPPLGFLVSQSALHTRNKSWSAFYACLGEVYEC